jgi:hypothetical protein
MPDTLRALVGTPELVPKNVICNARSPYFQYAEPFHSAIGTSRPCRSQKNL